MSLINDVLQDLEKKRHDKETSKFDDEDILSDLSSSEKMYRHMPWKALILLLIALILLLVLIYFYMPKYFENFSNLETEIAQNHIFSTTKKLADIVPSKFLKNKPIPVLKLEKAKPHLAILNNIIVTNEQKQTFVHFHFNKPILYYIVHNANQLEITLQDTLIQKPLIPDVKGTLISSINLVTSEPNMIVLMNLLPNAEIKELILQDNNDLVLVLTAPNHNHPQATNSNMEISSVPLH